MYTHLCSCSRTHMCKHTFLLMGTRAPPSLNTCPVTLLTLDWVFSWLNAWNWNYPNKLFWQLLKVFWSKPECLSSQCFHTESVRVTVRLCLFLCWNIDFFFHCSSSATIKMRGNEAAFCGFSNLVIGESLFLNALCNLLWHYWTVVLQ